LIDARAKLPSLEFEIEFEKITFCKKIGHGASANVWSAIYGGTMVAVKQWNPYLLTGQSVQQFKQEVKFIRYE
jgi:hypothetical protein